MNRYAFERGHNNDTATFALLARIVLLREQADGYDDDRLTHWLGETYDNTAMAAVMTRSSTGIEAAMQWLKLLHERIERYNSPEDTLASATAHNLLGICYCRQDEFAKAAESFTMSLETFRSVEDRPKYSGVFPAVSLAHLHVQQDHATEAEDIILPFLQEHEESLGTDDTTTTQCVAPYPMVVQLLTSQVWSNLACDGQHSSVATAFRRSNDIPSACTAQHAHHSRRQALFYGRLLLLLGFGPRAKR